jgi:hypothetical protein
MAQSASANRKKEHTVATQLEVDQTSDIDAFR